MKNKHLYIAPSLRVVMLQGVRQLANSSPSQTEAESKDMGSFDE